MHIRTFLKKDITHLSTDSVLAILSLVVLISGAFGIWLGSFFQLRSDTQVTKSPTPSSIQTSIKKAYSPPPCSGSTFTNTHYHYQLCIPPGYTHALVDDSPTHVAIYPSTQKPDTLLRAPIQITSSLQNVAQNANRMKKELENISQEDISIAGLQGVAVFGTYPQTYNRCPHCQQVAIIVGYRNTTYTLLVSDSKTQFSHSFSAFDPIAQSFTITSL